MSWWVAAIQIGMAAVSAISKNNAEKAGYRAQKVIDEANANIQNMVGEANADAANAVRGANNKFAVAKSNLSNLLRSLGNQGKLQSGGDAVNALNTNLVRLHDQAVTGSLNQRIIAAEQLGALQAQAAASGAGGTSSAMLHQTMQLAQARAATTHDQTMKYQTYDMLAQRAGVVGNTVLSLDQGQDFAPIDYGINVAPFVQAPFRLKPPNAFDAFFMNGGGQAIGQSIGSMYGGGAGAAGGAAAGGAGAAGGAAAGNWSF